MSRRLARRDEPREYSENAARAERQRHIVAAQLAAHIVRGHAGTGSKQFVALRIHNFAEAERCGDLYVVRAALMDLAGAAGAYVTQIDLSLPQHAPGEVPEMTLRFPDKRRVDADASGR